MVQEIPNWFKHKYRKTINSIAFLPAVMALFFLFLSYFMITFDFSETGKTIKSNLHWLSLKDASTARSICSAITAGILSLTVFSFSMVMILLNQTASQMSNRILVKLIGNRFQQIVLGFYIGTIVYSLFLLSTIRDINSGIYVPAISTYLLIALTVTDIFLFIYFLHYITNSVKYETIIHKIYESTVTALKKSCTLRMPEAEIPPKGNEIIVNAFKSGIYQGINEANVLKICTKMNAVVHFLVTPGTYLMQETPVLAFLCPDEQKNELKKMLNAEINIDHEQEIETNYYYGFRQLLEIAVKALSPGINDPGTAVISFRALANLLAYRLLHHPPTVYKDQNDCVRMIFQQYTAEELFDQCVLPIWDYGKNDRIIQREMVLILTQLFNNSQNTKIEQLLLQVKMTTMNY